MKKIMQTSLSLLVALAASAAAAHPGHGVGAVGHDLQHQLWMFGALVAVGGVCMFAQKRNTDQE